MNTLVISGSFVAAQIVGGGPMVTEFYGPIMNPAIAFGVALFQGDFSYPQYFLMPFVGSICALIFYEFVFVKTQEYLAEDSEEEEDAAAKGEAEQIDE